MTRAGAALVRTITSTIILRLTSGRKHEREKIKWQ